MNIIKKYYCDYQFRDGFDRFHNEVINMPRDSFLDSDIKKVRILASYLLLIAKDIQDSGNSYKDFMRMIKEKLDDGIIPELRDVDIENRYFNYQDLNHHYGDEGEGRMFRHLMGLCSFFGLITSKSRRNKVIVEEKCQEYVWSDEVSLLPIARNNLISLNANSNDYIKSLNQITIDEYTDYKPAYAIIKYIYQIERPVSEFELSVLLGRIDYLKTEKEILDRAMSVGKDLPTDISKQQEYFFLKMGWVNESTGNIYVYRSSQQPNFKFKRFILYMQSYGLINISNSGLVTLTDYSIKILQDDISYLIADLEQLIITIEESDSNSELNNIILYQRNPQLLDLAKKDSKFIEKMNYRSLNNPIYKNNKRVRNRLIAELAKILVDYKCQYSDRHLFMSKYGKYYCESHHILEFSTENGPDITDNLLVIGPEPHTLIHHAHYSVVDDFYFQLIKKGVLSFERFENMIVKYHCLTHQHIDILKNKKIITSDEELKLHGLINQYESAYV